MPRNGSGVYSKPAGTTAIADTLIESAKYNQTIDDLVADANEARPITAGGTGGVTAIAGCDNLSTKGADIASATTTDIGAATGRYVNITGTTTITGLGTKTAGVVRICTFTGALTLTHNATSLILPGGANITTAAGDVAVFVSEGSGNWRCASFQRQSNASVDVASATTTDIGAAASENVRITGTTTITGLGTIAAGIFRRVRFAGILTLTHNATSLILPGAANITTAAGDIAEFISEGSGNWRCIFYRYAEFRASGGVVEKGSNANGEYSKFADGTMLCWLNTTVTDQAITGAYSSLFSGTRVWTFPVAFSVSPTVPSPGVKWGSGASWGVTSAVSTTTASFIFLDAVSRASGTSTLLNFFAVGRWF